MIDTFCVYAQIGIVPTRTLEFISIPFDGGDLQMSIATYDELRAITDDEARWLRFCELWEAHDGMS